MSTSSPKPPSARTVLRRHAAALREQADRVDTLLSLFGRRRLPAFDYDITLSESVAALCQASKPGIIAKLSTDDELVARTLLERIAGTEKDKPSRARA